MPCRASRKAIGKDPGGPDDGDRRLGDRPGGAAVRRAQHAAARRRSRADPRAPAAGDGDVGAAAGERAFVRQRRRQRCRPARASTFAPPSRVRQDDELCRPPSRSSRVRATRPRRPSRRRRPSASSLVNCSCPVRAGVGRLVDARIAARADAEDVGGRSRSRRPRRGSRAPRHPARSASATWPRRPRCAARFRCAPLAHATCSFTALTPRSRTATPLFCTCHVNWCAGACGSATSRASPAAVNVFTGRFCHSIGGQVCKPAYRGATWHRRRAFCRPDPGSG